MANKVSEDRQMESTSSQSSNFISSGDAGQGLVLHRAAGGSTGWSNMVRYMMTVQDWQMEAADKQGNVLERRILSLETGI